MTQSAPAPWDTRADARGPGYVICLLVVAAWSEERASGPMPLNVRYDGKLIVLSNFGRLLNDPRYHDASRDVRELLEQGGRRFAFEMSGIRDVGPAGLGLLMTITRLIRQYDGDAVLFRVRPELTRFLDEMRMDVYWETFDTLEDARGFFRDEDDPRDFG